MARITNQTTSESVTLLTQHIFGRHPTTSHTVLVMPEASRTHASIFWDGEDWLLQDSSTNGSYVNGKLIQRGTKQRIHIDDVIQFASLDADSWKVDSDCPPKSLLVPVTTGLKLIELESLAVLPNEENPEITLYLSPNGHWICESPSGISVLATGDLVGTSDEKWRFIEAKASDETCRIESVELPKSSQLGIFFDVSQNEEHVSLRFILDGYEYDLGQRNHHYLLLLLARKRLEDKEAGVTEAEQGWLDKDLLCKMLGQNEGHVNIQIYRFRKQLVSTFPKSSHLPQPIERRTGEMRFAYANVDISGGSKLTVTSSRKVV